MAKKSSGRPTKYDPSYCEDIVEWFRSFRDDENACPLFEDYADRLNVSMTSLFRWREAHEEFRNAYEQAKGIQYSIMVQRGLNGTFNGGFTKFAMGNMHGWSDNSEQKVTVTEFTFEGDDGWQG